MFDLARHGGSVDLSDTDFPIRLILHRVVLAGALLLGLCWPTAHAGALYRCDGSSGETVFSSSTAGYHACTRVSTYGGATLRRRVPAAPLTVKSLSQVVGSVTTSARNLAADGAAPTSLAAVISSVESGMRLPSDARVQHSSFAAARGSVETNAATPTVVAAGPPGQWSYSESRTATLDAAAAPTPDNKVLKGAVYRIVRADGSVEYTNLQSASSKGHAVTMLFSYIATCAACNLHSPIHWGSVSLNLTAYVDSIRAASVEYGVDEAFLRAIVHAESAFNPRAMSIKGAQGLMQLMPGTATDMGVRDAFDTDQNIRGGARYLGLMLRDFNGNERLAAAAYNAGPGAVQRYSGVPPYAETQVYVERVTALRKRYEEAIHRPLAANGDSHALSRM